jgi:SAM-dependent methyltransferase
MNVQATSAGASPVFRVRDRCVSCGGAQLKPLWSGNFSSEPVRSWLRAFHYEADTDAALSDGRFERVGCATCSMAFHRIVPDESWARVLYEEWISPRQIECFEQAHHGWNPESRCAMASQFIKHVLRLRKILGPDPRERRLRVLDFGCGDGSFLTAAELLGLDVFGIDFSVTRQGRAQRRGVTVCGSLAEFDALAVGELDAITMFEVLEHVVRPLELLVALGRRLRRGGVLVVEVPDCTGVPTVPRTFEQFHDLQPLEHLNHFTPATLRQICERAGYRWIAKPPAHVTTDSLAVLRSETTRFIQRRSTSQYFRLL